MHEQDISIDSAGASLAGTLCLPAEDGRFPVVLMIHGTGPLDRDENVAGQRLNVFNTIAHRLAGAGIASVRYDKRGCGKSEGDYYRAGHADFVRDAASWVDAIAGGQLGVHGDVYLLGHSEGCIIAPQVSIARPAVAGLVLLAPFVQGIESILLKQARQLEQEIASGRGFSGRFRKLLIGMLGGATERDQARLIRRLKSSTNDVIRVRLQKLPAKALRELMAVDPPAIFRQVTCPMLLVGGEKDLQCDPADVERIAALAPGETESHVVPNLTHILRLEPDAPGILRTGALAKEPIAPVVLDLIEEWMRRQGAQTLLSTLTER